MSAKKICDLHAFAHPLDQGCPYCSPKVELRTPSTPPVVKDQARLNLIQTYIALLPSTVSTVNNKPGAFLFAEKLAKRLGYQGLQGGMTLDEALKPALEELASFFDPG